jgi:hypothetical protein
MSRQEKRTRIRVVPPKLQLRGRDALSGSYPTNVRFSLDGRTGNYNINYNDVQTVVFGSRSNGTSWQDNMIGYWTMQRLGPVANATGSITYEAEISGPAGINVFPYMDYNFVPDSKFLYFGVSESYAHEGKAYNVNLNEANPTNGIEYPEIIPNKSYDFKPNYSAYGVLEGDPMIAINSTYPLLAQNLDSNKSIYAFTGSFGSAYPKCTYQPFTIAGWFYYDNTANNALNANILIAGPCRKDPWNVENIDYYASAVEDGTGGLSFQVAFISSSYSTKSMQLDTNIVSNLIGKWFHFAFTYDGATSTSDVAANINTIKVYVDGNIVTPLTLSENGTGFSGYNTNDPIYYGISSTYLACLNSNVTGSLAELAFFNKVLSQQEIAELYYSQVPWNKKRRVIAGTSIDLDNGPYPVDAGEYMTTFNRDGMLVTGSIVKGVGDNQEWVHFSPGQEMQPFHDQLQYAADAKGASVANPFFTTGSSISDVGEGFSSPLWSKNKIEIPMPVVSASSIGPVKGNFSSSPSAFENSYSSPMAYYNFDRKIWEPIGVGLNFNTSTLRNAIEYIPIGFFNGFLFTENVQPIAALHNIGYCGSDFGFPYHPKYHATGSQAIAMSHYITEPFLLEKAIITIGSCSWEVGSVNLSNVTSNITGSINTFFLLNQRRNQNIEYSKGIYAKEYGDASEAGKIINTNIPTSIPLSKDQYDASETTYVDTVRDILGFSQIYSFASGSLAGTYLQPSSPGIGLSKTTKTLADLIPQTDNDIVIESQVSNISGSNWSLTNMALQMSLGVPCFGSLPPYNVIGGNSIVTRYNGSAITTDSTYIGYDGSRTGLNLTQLSTQGLVNDLFVGTNLEPAYTSVVKALTSPRTSFNFVDEKYKVNPYILYPTDHLIIGCQAPVSINPVQYTTTYVATPVAESTLTFGPDTDENRYQITLYGSYIKENKEYNDGTNQLLSSNGIHEVIE